MNLSRAIDATLTPTNPFSAGNEIILTGASLVLAIAFLVYLGRCYVQEFRREQRVRKRKMTCRATCDFQPIYYESPLLSTARTEEPAAPVLPRKLDCWVLQWAIPEHERITMVWDKPGQAGAPSAAFYVRRDDPEPKTV